MRVWVVTQRLEHGAPPDVRDVEVQARAVGAALAARGHAVHHASCELDLRAFAEQLSRERPDVVFNLVEELGGRESLAPLAAALCEGLAIPYTGAQAQALLGCAHKVEVKRRLRRAGVRTPEWIELEDANASVSAAGALDRATWIMKSATDHGSVGLDDTSVLTADAARLRVALEERRARGLRAPFAERYLDGREFNVAVLGSRHALRVLPPAEIEFLGFPPGKPKILGYSAKWSDGSFESEATVRRFLDPLREPTLVSELVCLARASCELLGVDGYARVDFRLDHDGRPSVLEVNPNPCFSPDAGFAAALHAAALSYEDACELLLRHALERRNAA
jgi:D-alanine-D-alanine ligase